MARSLCVVALSLLCACSNVKFWEKEKEDNTDKLILLLAAAYLANPCNFTASPVLTSAQPSGTMTGVAGSIKGKLLTRAGTPAISALVIAEDNAGIGVNYWATHSSINRDGSFQISGIPGGTTVKLSFESILSDYNGRIDGHIDCFKTPSTFTAGWATGGTLTTARASGQNFAIVNATTLDAGTIYLVN